LDFSQVKEHATHLCTALVETCGLKETDTVSLFSHNVIWYPVAIFAVLRAGMFANQSSPISLAQTLRLTTLGGQINGASPSYTVDEMTAALKTARTKYIMTVPSSIPVALSSAKKAGIPQKNIFLLEGEVDGYMTVKNLLEIGKSFGEQRQTPHWRTPSNDICGYLNFSSGTTGLPKAVSPEYRLSWEAGVAHRLIGYALSQKRNCPMSSAKSCGRTMGKTISSQPTPIPQ
jgi:acyl-CoA synthetase (AMP-forming)/AMP-acid ligase II